MYPGRYYPEDTHFIFLVIWEHLADSIAPLCASACLAHSRECGVSNASVQACALRAAVPFEVSPCCSWYTLPQRSSSEEAFTAVYFSFPHPPHAFFPVSTRFSLVWGNYADHKIFFYYKWCARNNMSFVFVFFLLQIITWCHTTEPARWFSSQHP